MTDRPVPDPPAGAAPEAGSDLTAEWILDALWLAVASAAGEEDEPGNAADGSADEGTADRDAAADESRLDGPSPGPDEDEERPVSSGSAAVPLRLGGRALGQVPAREVGFGAPGPIRDPLALPRSLRRLRQVRRPGPGLEIDIDATVEATAEAAGRLVPVFTRRLERSLDLALVVDRAPSMRIWRETLDEFALLLGQTGAFRTVSRWTLAASPAGVTVEDPRGTAHHPARLIDPSGRRLVFLATDATSQTWYEAGLWGTLATWCAAMPVALIQMLPPDYWAATAVGGPPYLMGRAIRPASPNAEYARRLGWWAADPGGEFLPVVPLTPRGLDGWARSAVNGTAWAAGITTAGPAPGRVPARSAGAARHSVALVGEFKSRASPGAERLARVLSSATTLSTPLISILQRRLAPQTDVPELAEVLASGLLEEISSPAEAADPDDFSSLLLRFRPGVREILQRGTTTIDRWKAYDEVSRYLDEHQGASGPLRAKVADPNGNATMNAADEPFAELKLSLAIRLGLVSAVPEQGESPDGHGTATDESVRAPDQEAPDTSAETEELLRSVLATEIAALPDDRLLTLVDFSDTSFDRWTISRDKAGTPQVRQQAFQEHELLDGGSLAFLVCTSPDNLAAWVALNRARTAAQAPRVFTCRASLPRVLAEAVAETPLTRQYGLAVLRASRSRQLSVDFAPLFHPGDRRGFATAFPVRIEPGGDPTVFAVFATGTAALAAPSAISVMSAMIPPGTYPVSALLDGPGRVTFRGLPSRLQPDPRPWSAIAESIPARLEAPESAHLICAIDVNGSSRQVRQRIDAADQLITAAASEVSSLLVSVVAYGAHSFQRGGEYDLPTAIQWEANAQAALGALAEPQHSPQYIQASALECALAEIGNQLSGGNTRQRTVLVTLGSRRPYPPRLDATNEILPCPLRRDWRLEEENVRRFVTAFGAIHDARPNGEIWDYLGRDARGFADSLDVPAFLTELGLRRTQQSIPLPLLADDARAAPEAVPANNTGGADIVLLGPPASGKTMLLAALNAAAAQADPPWRVLGGDPDSTEFMSESTEHLISDRVFPPATLATERVRVTFRGSTTRTTGSRFRQRKEAVPFDVVVTMADPAGEIFTSGSLAESQRTTIIDTLANSSGIIYTFDPTREFERGDSYAYLYGIIHQLASRLSSDPEFSGRFPHYLAVCVNKFDEPRVLESAQRFGLVTIDPNDPFEFPRVRGNNARQLFEVLLNVSSSSDELLLKNLIDGYFHPDRVRYFVTSSIGFHQDPSTGKFNSEDPENAVRTPSGTVTIRGPLHPIDVAEPFVWLAEQIAAGPPPPPAS